MTAERTLDLIDLPPDPLTLLVRWRDEAAAAGALEPSGMCLATVSPDGYPDARMVLLRGIVPEGVLFYTNYDSRKGRALAATPRAALCFHWAVHERQLRLQGHVEPAAPEVSDAYFAGRPRESRIGAWASPQSRPVADRAELDARYAEAEARFAGKDVPRPPHWGGFLVRPFAVEVWQGRAARMHDRFRYDLRKDGTWDVMRLAP